MFKTNMILLKLIAAFFVIITLVSCYKEDQIKKELSELEQKEVNMKMFDYMSEEETLDTKNSASSFRRCCYVGNINFNSNTNRIQFQFKNTNNGYMGFSLSEGNVWRFSPANPINFNQTSCNSSWNTDLDFHFNIDPTKEYVFRVFMHDNLGNICSVRALTIHATI